MGQRKEELEREIGTLAEFVAQGDSSPAVRAASSFAQNSRDISIPSP
jgi:hypothetical protein